MKKLILLFAAVCFVVSAATAQPVQLQKGKILTGVTSTMSMCGTWDSNTLGLGFTKTKYQNASGTEDAYSSIIFNLLPKAGYFFMDNLVGGLELALSGELNKDTDDGDKYRESMIAIGPFVRYYYPLDKLYPFAEAELMFGTWAEGEPGDPDYTESFAMFGIYLGAALPLGDMVTFDGMIGYSRASWAWEAYEGEGVDRSFDGGLAVKAGFTIYLR